MILRCGLEQSVEAAGLSGAAIIGSIAAQQQLGLEKVQPLPNSVAERVVDTLRDHNLPQHDKDAALRSMLIATPPEQRRVSRKRVRDKLIVPPVIKRDVNGILQSAVIDESKLAFDPNGPGEWGAFFGDPIGAVYGKIASSRAGSIKGWNNEGDAKRHAAWNADMTQSIGVGRAKAFADAHEISVPDPDPERTMDLLNNHNARELAEALKDTDLTPNDIADLAFRFGYLQSEPVHTRKK